MSKGWIFDNDVLRGTHGTWRVRGVHPVAAALQTPHRRMALGVPPVLESHRNHVTKGDRQSAPHQGRLHPDPDCSQLETFTMLRHAVSARTYKESEGAMLLHPSLPHSALPQVILQVQAKGIYSRRNPRDVVISSYHFWNSIKIADNLYSLEEYFEWPL